MLLLLLLRSSGLVRGAISWTPLAFDLRFAEPMHPAEKASRKVSSIWLCIDITSIAATSGEDPKIPAPNQPARTACDRARRFGSNRNRDRDLGSAVPGVSDDELFGRATELVRAVPPPARENGTVLVVRYRIQAVGGRTMDHIRHRFLASAFVVGS